MRFEHPRILIEAIRKFLRHMPDATGKAQGALYEAVHTVKRDISAPDAPVMIGELYRLLHAGASIACRPREGLPAFDDALTQILSDGTSALSALINAAPEEAGRRPHWERD